MFVNRFITIIGDSDYIADIINDVVIPEIPQTQKKYFIDNLNDGDEFSKSLKTDFELHKIDEVDNLNTKSDICWLVRLNGNDLRSMNGITFCIRFQKNCQIIIIANREKDIPPAIRNQAMNTFKQEESEIPEELELD